MATAAPVLRRLKPTVDIVSAFQGLRSAGPAAPPRPQQPGVSQVTNEPILGVGARTGKVHFVAGEKAPESIVIGDGSGPGQPMPGAPGVRGYSTGGEVQAGVEQSLGHALTPEQQQFFDANVDKVTGPGPAAPAAPGAPVIKPPAFANSGGLLPNAAPKPPAAPATGAQTAQYTAQQGVNTAQQAEITAGRQTLAAGGGQDASQGAYISEQERANAAAKADVEAIIAARNDVQNQTDIARARNDRANEDYKYGIGGLATPQDIILPKGYAGPLPPGVRGKIETNEEILTRQAQEKAQLEQTAVETARLASQKSTLTVNQAARAAQEANLNTSQAQLEVRKAQTPPFPGALFDDYSGQWLTAAQMDQAQAQRGLTRDPSDPTGATYSTHADLASRTDQAGNIRNATTGILTDPRTGNQFLDGKWVDPRNGNVLHPDIGPLGAWVAPNGNIYHITNRASGAGYWTDPQGNLIEFPGKTSGGSVDLSGLFGP